MRFIGDPLVRIAEDHLRILRFFRFLARFGDSPDADGLQACTDRANDLMALSRERIANELLRLLVAPNAVATVSLMIEHGIFRPIIPEIETVERLARTAHREEAATLAPSALLRLVSLLPDSAVDNVGARLKLSKDDRKRMTVAAQPLLTPNVRELCYRLGRVSACDQLILSELADDAILAGLRELDEWTPPRLPLSGGQLVAKGLTAGPDVARTLRQVENHWIAEGFPDAARVDAIADAEVAQVLDAIR